MALLGLFVSVAARFSWPNGISPIQPKHGRKVREAPPAYLQNRTREQGHWNRRLCTWFAFALFGWGHGLADETA
jgi:hypothetical protein